MKWIFDQVNNRVVTEDDSATLFYTDKLYCVDSVVRNVVELHNNNIYGIDEIGSDGIIDSYLLDECECTTEDKEIICEGIANYLINNFYL